MTSSFSKKTPFTSRIGVCVIASSALGFGALAAHAAFSYPDFSSTSGLQLNGVTATAGTALRLTAATPSQAGSAFTTTSTPLGASNSFSTYFQFKIGDSGGI